MKTDELGRPIEDVALELHWVPEGGNPRISNVPWFYFDERKALVEVVITTWLTNKELGVKDLNIDVDAGDDADLEEVEEMKSNEDSEDDGDVSN